MTTNVTVNAHCNPETTRVLVETHDENWVSTGKWIAKWVYLEDGEVGEYVVFDNQALSVSEVPKSVSEVPK